MNNDYFILSAKRKKMFSITRALRRGHSLRKQTQFLQNITIAENDKITFESNLQPSSQVNSDKTVVVKFAFATELSPFAILLPKNKE